MHEEKKLTTEQKAKLIAYYLLKKDEVNKNGKAKNKTPWKGLIGFRNV